MCDPERLLERLNSVLVSVRTQNSAADIHEIGNIRNTCQMLIQAIEDKSISDEEAYKMCLRLEDQVVKFFIRKYAYLDPKLNH